MKIRKTTRDGQIFYEMTKEDFEKLKDIITEEIEEIRREERNKGRDDVINYMFFSAKNFHLEFNITGINSFVRGIICFVCGETDTIENVYGYSFWDYVEKYR